MKKKNPLLILIVSAGAAFLSTFNETFLNVAFTPIMNYYNVGVSTVQWLTTLYMLGAAIMVPISSFMYRKYSTKPLFLFTVGLLLFGNIICIFAPNYWVLLVGRIIQSIGTGMLIPIGMNLTLSVVPKEKIGTYMGVMGAMTTLGPAISIISAGVILNFFSFKALFVVFTILTSILFILACIILGKNKVNDNPVLDGLSVILISLSLIGILYGISTIFTGNLYIALISIIIGVISLILFGRRQIRIDDALINLDTLGVSAFRRGFILNNFALIIVFAMNIIMPLFIQNALGVEAFIASLTLFPAVVCSCIIAPIAGRTYDKHGVKTILPMGFLLIFIFVLLISLFRDFNSLILIGLLYIPVICGSAFIIGPVQSYALSHLNKELNPHGVTVMSTGFQIAGCIGSSLFTGIYALVLTKSISSGTSNYSSLSLAFFTTLLSISVLAFIGFIISLRLRRDTKHEEVVSNLTLKSIMKSDVYTVLEKDSLLTALSFITDKKISGVPVLNSKSKLVGFISDGDIMRCLSRNNPMFNNVYSLAALSINNEFDDKLMNLMSLKVKDVMKKKLITVDVNTPLEDVCSILVDNHMKKAPVMDNGKMVGVINRSNITDYVIKTYLQEVE